jgi:hypothetical protein
VLEEIRIQSEEALSFRTVEYSRMLNYTLHVRFDLSIFLKILIRIQLLILLRFHTRIARRRTPRDLVFWINLRLLLSPKSIVTSPALILAMGTPLWIHLVQNCLTWIASLPVVAYHVHSVYCGEEIVAPLFSRHPHCLKVQLRFPSCRRLKLSKNHPCRKRTS